MIDEAIIRQLGDPRRFPGGVDAVIQYQTHLSLVCVAGDRAYKLKKALRLPFVDFSSLSKRQRACEEEVALNQRLCPNTYIGVVPLYASSGRVSFCRGDGAGEIIDYAVLMRRLQAHRMLDSLLAQGAVVRPDIEQIAAVIAKFHGDVALAPGSGGSVHAADRLRDFALANFDETADHIGSIFDSDLHRKLHARAVEDFDHYLPMLRRRAMRGLVVDGHGDLHARNICLCEPLAIYDCLEFSRDLRIGDVAVENAFLIMDLRYRGHADLGDAYLDHYVALSDDDQQRDLIPMMLRYRAMVRAKVAAIAAGEDEIDSDDREGAVGSARRHLNLMAASAIEQNQSWLICACGLPASGKSFVFDAIERATCWPCYASDRIRKELAGIAPNVRAPLDCYTREASAGTYAEIFRRAGEQLHSGPVLIDANFASVELRLQAQECARGAGAQVAFVWFQADDRQVEKRMKRRVGDPDGVSDANLEIYRMLKMKFEAPTSAEVGKLIVALADGDCDQQVATILRELM